MSTTPEHPQDIYDVLANLRHALGNASQITGHCLDLKASADRLLPLVTGALRRVQEAIEAALPSLPDEEEDC
jgi:hypothetical protein